MEQEKMALREWISQGKAVLGVELGSTRIKAVLLGPDNQPIASGGHGWENRLENGIWTYPLEEVWAGLQESYRKLSLDVREKYDAHISGLSALGISAMMHGYLPFDKEGNPLCEFRTWRNTMTEEAAEQLTELFAFNIPQRWSIAHLYQAMLKKEAHLPDISFLTTLAGYVHWKLTGRKVLGVGEASGMFPIDSAANDFHGGMIEKFDKKAAAMGYSFTLSQILPKVLAAGENAGLLTPEGAALLDPSGALQAGAICCPPEGDAGTGMVATNSVAPKTGNVSAGTSIFAMLVLEHPLSRVYPEIDMVTTPSGKPVAMVHCNNCTSDLDAWVRLFAQLLEAGGAKLTTPQLYDLLYFQALEADPDCGGVISCNYFSGEPITGFSQGRPLLVRKPNAAFTLPNLMRAHLYGALATLKIGMDILTTQEAVEVQKLTGHGGLFKTPGVGQRLMAAAVNTPVTVMSTAGEGGAWGVAVLAAYARDRKEGRTLEDYLESSVFAGDVGETVMPNSGDVEGFTRYMKDYTACLAVERSAVENME